MRLFLCVVAILGLLSAGSVGFAQAGSEVHAQPVPSSKAAANPADFVGSETCTACHEDISTKFSSNPHWKLALTHGGNGVTCEACHGPGKEHVDGGGDVTKIFQFSKASENRSTLPASAVTPRPTPILSAPPTARLRSAVPAATACSFRGRDGTA